MAINGNSMEACCHCTCHQSVALGVGGETETTEVAERVQDAESDNEAGPQDAIEDGKGARADAGGGGMRR